MIGFNLNDCLERSPIIAAVNKKNFKAALNSPCELIFFLSASLLDVEKYINEAHKVGKKIFVHIDLAEGIGKDRAGVEFLANLKVDGIISTRAQIIKHAKDLNILTVQRFFALDSKGLDSISDMLENANPDLIEIMPGVVFKAIKRFSNYSIPVIAGGLIETKAEVTEALSNGAEAVSTGKIELWSI
jgi:glycerol uptake operon antiterminator